MKSETALLRLAALSQAHRLAAFRALVRSGPQGLYASDLAQRLKLAPATLSFHLKELVAAGLVKAHPEGRWIRYAPQFKAMQGLVDYLYEHCCEGEPCAAPTPCCPTDGDAP